MKKMDVYELTNPQKNIWSTEKFFSGTNINNVCGRADISEKVDFAVLKDAIQVVLKTNAIFSINFKLIDGKLFQYIVPYHFFDVKIIDVKTEEDVKMLEKSLYSKVYKIEDGFLYDTVIYRFPNGKGGFFLNTHHLLGDSWSLGLYCKKVIQAYTWLIENDKTADDVDLDTIPGMSSNYIDYCIAEKEYLASSKFEKDKQYWNEKFETIPEVASLPSQSKKDSKLTCAGNRITFEFSKDISAKINEFCKLNNVSNFNFITAVYSLYISRCCNLEDFVIGTPLLNRTNFTEKNTEGMFVSTAPLRINLKDTTTFVDLAKNIAKDSMSMLRHQKYPYEYLLKTLREKEPNLPNLYNILISYQITKTTIDGLKHNTYWAFNGTCADELQMHILDLNDSGTLNISYQYKTEKYEEQEITDLHKRIEHIISQVLQNPEILLNTIEIVTPAEKDEILNIFNNTNVDYPKDKTIVDLFEEQVEKTPNNIAVSFEGKTLTYKELNEKANQLANYLRENGIKTKTVIGLRLNKGFEMIIGIIAIIKAGCCYLPINMHYPEDRVQFMLEDSKSELLLGTSDSLNEFNLNIDKLNIELDNNKIFKTYKTKNLKLKITPEDLIYIIYTSGSTGKPKGAMLCHRNVVRLFRNDKFQFDFNENDSWTMFHSVAFDFSVWEMYGALLFGGKLVLVTDEVAQDPTLLLDLMRKENVTILNQTPTYFYKLQKAEIEILEKRLKIRYIVFGGEALKPNLIQDWHKKYPKCKLINMYGITETTVHVTFKELKEEDLKSPSSNIGTPIPTLGVIIVDKNMNLLPYGVEGEMCILGEGVFKGYLNREELNKTKIIINKKYSNSPIYKSGDTAIMHKDGYLEYLGRIDTQIKIRGFRIELGEIEEKICKYSNIETCIVTKKIDKDSREMLCAYYIPDGPINIPNLRIVLSKHLPNYMIPQYFIEIAKIPININGKTDFKALPLPKISEANNNNTEVRNSIDKTILDIYQKVLNIDSLSIEDSFFNLGGDSLTAITVSEKISKELNIDVKVKDILEKDIIKDLSDYISKRSDNSNVPTILKAKKQEYYPLSNSQKNIYYASKMSATSLLYNVCGGLLINKKLDPNKVTEIFNKIIANHTAFRTYFKLVDDEPKQFVLDEASIYVKAINKKETDIHWLVNSYAKELNLEKAPILNCEINYIENQTLLLINTHHIIIDGTSLNIIIKEFCSLYNNQTVEKEKIEYTDFTLWEKDFIKTEEYQNQEKMWQNEFKGRDIPVINLPYDSAILQPSNSSGDTLYNIIDEDIFQEIVKLAFKLKVSPYTVFLSAFYILLYKYTNQNEIIVGSPISGRFDKSLENTLGMFVNNIPLLLDINDNTKIEDFINIVKEKAITALDNGLFPYLKLQKMLNNNSIFDVMFIYQNENDELPKIDNEPVSVLYANTKTSKFKLSMEIIPTTRKLNIEYNTNIFKEKTIQRLVKHYINLLKLLPNKINNKIKNVCVITEKEKDIILKKFNNTKDISFNSNILELFKKQVAEKPNNYAVIFENQKITYKELNEKSNSLAKYLKFIGVKENDTISLNMHRSIELIIAIYAAIKCGATYVLIDPSLPQERIKYIVKNSNSKLIIVDDLTNNNISLENSININNFDYKYYDSKDEQTNFNNQNLCIIYTSGSTGNPKGVILHHKGFSSLMYALDKAMNISECRNILGIATVSFDMFAFELYTSTLFGNTLILANEEEQRNSIAMSKLIKNNNVNFLVTTPSRIQLLLDKQCENPLQNVDSILLGGEIFTPDLYNKLRESTNAKLYNGYGPTEITACCSVKLVSSSKVTIGRPLANSRIYICDDNLNLAPIGIIGEICVAGTGVASGYLNNPEATAQKFIKNPFGEGYLYRTGDMGRFTKKGEIEYLGRKDFQIKIRGLRIEISEIETYINSLNTIEKSVVLYNNVDNFPYLTAFVTSKDTINVHEIKEQLSKLMPSYMIPRYIIQLDSFPITLNGKIDKKKLSEYKYETTSNINAYVAPTTEKQKIFCKLWSELLNIKVGIDDDLFDIGADSLLAIKFKSRLLAYNIDIPYADIFKYRTIRNLCNITHEENTTYKPETITNYDRINNLLQNQKDTKIISDNSNNVLLLGSTGFVGIHIIDSFIKNCKGKIYCIVREKNKISSLVRFTELLHFYFGNKLDKYIDDRIIILNGDIIKPNFGLSNKAYTLLSNEIDTVINSAANVKHYGKKEKFIEANINSLKPAIKFCTDYNKRLIHISTLSISGNMMMLNSSADEKKYNKSVFTENSFYIGQSLDNLYARSKFEAEKIIYTEILENGLNAQVIRLGNITNRYKDGHFQINPDNNAFANKLKAFLAIKTIPDYLLNNYLEFTPVDYCAEAIIKILNNNSINRYVYHVYNDNHVYFFELIKYLKKYGYKIEICNQNQFNEKIANIISTGKEITISGIINDFDTTKKINYSSYITIKGEKTKNILMNQSFKWPKITYKYIEKYLNYLKEINFIK